MANYKNTEKKTHFDHSLGFLFLIHLQSQWLVTQVSWILSIVSEGIQAH